MRKSIEKLLNDYEKLYPRERALNDQATEDLLSNGEVSPAKPLAMHVAESLDEGLTPRELFSENFDHLLSPEERKGIGGEIVDLAELSAILNHPEFLIDESEEPSETRAIGKEVFMHLLSKYGPEGGYEHIMKKLVQPMLSLLLDKVIDENSLSRQVLGPTMVKRSKHRPEDYNKRMEMAFTAPIIDGKRKQNWEKAIPEIFQMLNGGKNG